VDVVYHGVDPKRFNYHAEEGEAEWVKAAIGVSDPFLLYLGGGDRRKRLPLLIRAYARAQRTRDVVLVIAGALTRHQRKVLAGEARAAGVSSRVIFPGFVADRLVPALYRACLGHVFPSIYEGFGLPVLEAMSCGAPTVTTLETSLAEVAGEAALGVPADDEAALAGAIRRLVDDSALRRELSVRGPAWAAHFTWRRCADETLTCYRKALEE
jgi:glycosyltransferase involved in cell wall biosynthesis